MNEADAKPVKVAKLPEEKGTTIGKMSLIEVDAALAECEKRVKVQIDTVKVKLNSNAAIPPSVLRELSRGNSQKSRLMMRRISLLIDSGDAAVVEILDKLMKLKPQRT